MTRDRVDEVDAVLLGRRARRDRRRSVGVDREREDLRVDVVLGVAEDVLVFPVRVVRRADRAQVPAGEHARRRVDVRFLDVRDAEREQLHDLAREVLLRLGLGVQPAVEPHQHRRILGDGDQQVAEVPQRVLPEQLELTRHAARRFAGLAGHHRGRDSVAVRSR